MPTRTYNTFYQWVQQDDFLSNGANFIEHKNVDGLTDGYWLKLWPKVNKLLTSSDKVIRALYVEQLSDGDLSESYSGWDDGVIYRFTATDDTPTYTMANSGNIIGIYELGSDLYFLYKPDLTSSLIGCAKITKFAANNDTWAADLDESFIAAGTGLWNPWIPPVIEFNNLLYVWSGTWVRTINSSWLVSNFTFPWDVVSWLSLQGSTVVVYTRWGIVYYWDGVSSTYQAIKNVKSRISKVTSKGWRDYILTEDGQFILGSGLSFTRVTKPKKSKRMNNNASFNTRLDFSLSDSNLAQNRIMSTVLDDVYMFANDTIPGFYKYGHIIPWMQDGSHKVITQDNAATAIDVVYDTIFYERNLRRMYFSYKAWSIYWIDYIDLKSLETCTNGYVITDVFSSWAALKKQISKLRLSYQNTSWNNYVKLYYRVNNGSWVEIRNINEAVDEINRQNINTVAWEQFQQFIDVQFKVELNNDTWAEDSPMLHELMLDYNFIEV